MAAAADRIEQLEAAIEQSRADTAAAYERAAREVDCNGCSGNCCDPANCRMHDAAAIRACATPDQTAALDAVKAEAWEQGMRDAAEIAMAETKLPSQYNIKDQWRENIGKECAKAILAAVKGKTK
jgi:hypothetical protein